DPRADVLGLALERIAAVVRSDRHRARGAREGKHAYGPNGRDYGGKYGRSSHKTLPCGLVNVFDNVHLTRGCNFVGACVTCAPQSRPGADPGEDRKLWSSCRSTPTGVRPAH